METAEKWNKVEKLCTEIINFLNVLLLTALSNYININIFQKKISPDLLEPPEEVSDQVKEESQPKTEDSLGAADLFKNPTLLKNLLVMFVAWIVVTLGTFKDWILLMIRSGNLNQKKFKILYCNLTSK